ncbi:MAG: nicotinate phosphoribosyltransferase [Thermoproteota archaeon]|jgi:nicotinate phosphoribosyltransferase
MHQRKFYIATDEEILSGKVTDVYYPRTYLILKEKNKLETNVTMDVHAYNFPKNYNWAVFCGLKEVINLFLGKKVDVYAMDEGTIFRLYEPVLSITGPYSEFGIYEPVIDGILRHNTSMATKAARCKKLAMDKMLVFFGIRSIHPAIAPMADRASFIGGCDAVSGVLGAELLGINPVGTMPHELTLIFDDVKEAWLAFDEVLPKEVPRIMLCDTMYDERTEVWLASKTLGERLYGVRIDTPSSRKGDIRKILQEIRWILDMNGLKHVKIVLSSGVDEETIINTRDLVDIYGIGTAIAFPPSIDLAFDIVEKEGKPYSKRGKMPGRKQVYRCKNCFNDVILLFNSPKPEKCGVCGGDMFPLLKKYIENGKLIEEIKSDQEIKKYVLEQLKKIQI